MDRSRLIQALHATTLADGQKQAGAFLDQCTNLVGFAPELLKIACDATIADTIRQAAVIYFKNVVVKFWEYDDDDEVHKKEYGDFQLAEQDKIIIKDNILDAVCVAGDSTRIQLCTAAQQVMRTEYPEKWPCLLMSIQQKLNTPDGCALQGALLIIYRLAKVYEYKRAKDRQPLVDAMVILLPIMLQHFRQLLHNQSQEAVTIQKLILKIFYSIVQFSLNLHMVSVDAMDSWLEATREVLIQPCPKELDSIEDKEERAHMVWWKCKKWAAKILDRVFERYGAPGQVESGYAEFANHFLQKFSIPCVEAMLQILNDQRQGIYVSDRVLHLALSFLNTAVSHSHTWRVIKPHAQEVIKTVLFSLLCHSDEDEEMWEDDVEEYIRFKFDIFEDLHNPSYGAAALLSAFSKRKDVMQPVLAFTIEVMSRSQEPREIDGALRMIGELSGQLTKSKKYKKDVEKLLDAHIIGRLSDSTRFIRARAAWCVKQYSSAQFNTPKILKKVIEILVKRLCDPHEELPVKVESALAIQMLLDDQQEKAHNMVKPFVQAVIPQVMELVAKTQIEDVVGVMDELLEQFMEDIIPIASDVAERLSELFLQVLGSDVAEDRTPALMSIISTLSNILEVVEEHREIMVKVEASVLKIIHSVLNTGNVDFYDDILLLMQSLMQTYVSEPMWIVFNDLYAMFKKDNNSLVTFSDIAPVLHLYITTDTEGFLARPERLNAVLDMCRVVLQDAEQGDENHLYAAKLLECLILQCNGAINEAIPAIMMLALQRLTQPFEDGLSELKPLLLLVVVAAVYTNTDLASHVLREIAPNHPNPLDYLTDELCQLSKKFEGVHNRKVALLGWCVLLRLSGDARPTVISYQPKRVIESCLTVFEGLQRALKTQAENKNSEWDSDDSDDDSDDDDTDLDGSGKKKKHNHRRIDDDLSDNEDEIDEGTLEYLETLAKENKRANRAVGGDEDDSNSDSDGSMFEEETDTEQFTTPLDDDNAPDVFVLFKQTMEWFEQNENILFNQMVGSLSADQAESLKNLITVCEQHVKSEESKRLEQAGGYSFNAAAPVPSTFNFSQ